LSWILTKKLMTNPHRLALQAEYDEGGLEQLLGVASAALQYRDAEIGRLREFIAEHPSKLSFDTLMWVGRRLLDEHYPASVIDGSSGDPGPEYVVALRAALARIARPDV